MLSWGFSKAFKTCYFTHHVASVKWLHYRPLSGKLPTILEHSKESLESVCVEVRLSGLQTCNVREKGTVLQRFFEIFGILEHRFLS